MTTEKSPEATGSPEKKAGAAAARIPRRRVADGQQPRTAPRPVRTVATKQKIFDAALTLIGERGAGSVTVDEIAAAAGVAKGTVYYNFGSKDNLVDALFRHGVELLETRLRAAETVPDIDRALETLIDAALSFFADYPAFTQLLVSELWRTPGQWHETLTTLRNQIVWVFRDQILRLSAAGRLPSTIEPKTVSAAVFGTLLVLVLDWQVFEPGRAREEIRGSILAILRGLTSEPPGRAPAGSS